MPTKPIPDGYHSVTPYLMIKDAAAAIEFYKKALDATVLFQSPGPDGQIMHAEIKIGDSILMLSDEWPDMNALGPTTRGGTTVGFCIYVEDCDARFEQAVAAGGTVERPVENQFYGDRSGTIVDPFGHKWTISTHVEDVTPEEMQKRMDAWMAQQA